MAGAENNYPLGPASHIWKISNNKVLSVKTSTCKEPPMLATMGVWITIDNFHTWHFRARDTIRDLHSLKA